MKIEIKRMSVVILEEIRKYLFSNLIYTHADVGRSLDFPQNQK